ncbi:hypothetical protein RB195_017062 [Necator americanus]|uniref:Uncharacterized protein n=1 Tax=Necator americanus TaxID=51031 RepID=A0ABR1C6K8_NECAM
MVLRSLEFYDLTSSEEDNNELHVPGWHIFAGDSGIFAINFVSSPLSSMMFSSFLNDESEVLEPCPAEISDGPSVQRTPNTSLHLVSGLLRLA